MRRCLWFGLVMLSACALQEPVPVTLAPLTIAPAPDLTLAGSCDESGNLSDWLQFTIDYAGQFTAMVSQAGAKSRGDMVEDIVMMGRLRDITAGLSTPDCAEPGQHMLVGAMDRAIATFTAYINQEADSLGNIVAETLGQFDQIRAFQDDLMERLETQLSTQNAGG